MDFYTLEIGEIKRKLPLVAISPKIKIASFNLLGDEKLVEVIAQELIKKLKGVEFDYLIGPEVKVVPLLHELSRTLNKPRYIVCRKRIHGYMVSPIKSKGKKGLVLDGRDVTILKNKKVIIIDDVISSGHTMRVVKELMENVGAKVIMSMAVVKQGDIAEKDLQELVYLGTLPIFDS